MTDVSNPSSPSPEEQTPSTPTESEAYGRTASAPEQGGTTPSAPTGSGAYGRGNPAPTSRVPIYEILLVYVLLLGAYFRLTPYTEKGNPKLQWGVMWGESQWLHPDERFLLFVGGDISPTKQVPVDPNNPAAGTKRVWLSLGDYFNTAQSSLNPNNKGYTFFVYGTLPIFLTRYIAEIAFNHHVGWNEIASVGRPLSALSDWLVILLVFLAASRLFNKRVGLLAAAFYSWAVLPIQLSHFYKEDTYTNFFNFLAIYFAILIATTDWRKHTRPRATPPVEDQTWPGRSTGDAGEEFTPPSEGAGSVRVGLEPTPTGTGPTGLAPTEPSPTAAIEPLSSLIRQPLLWYSLGFGVALGCAVASKILAAPVAAMLPIAFGVRLFTMPAEDRRNRWADAGLFIVLAAMVSLLTFRIFQPYAFQGPTFFNVGINKAWLDAILSQRAQTDFPPAMQWARRPFTFALKNLTVWGLGLPLGLLAWAGFLWAGWRMLKGEWQRHALPWIWTVGYYGFQMWQSHFNPSMRYFLPMYPTLVIFAAWILVWVWDKSHAAHDHTSLTPESSSARSPSPSGRGVGVRGWIQGYASLLRIAIVIVGAFVLIYTLLYAWGFSRIYTRQITRLAASRWIYQNIPGPIDLHIQSTGGQVNQPMPMASNSYVSQVTPYDAAFQAKADGTLTQVSLNNLKVNTSQGDTAQVTFAVTGPENSVTTASIFIDTRLPGGSQASTSPAAAAATQNYTLTFNPPLAVKKGVYYQVALTVEQSNTSFSLSGDMVANEGDWDDGIPYPIDGYSYSGIFPQQVPALVQLYTDQGVSPNDVNTLSTPNFNMYWEENNADKYNRFIRILDATQYIFITSNRQWGSLPRIPERFPMTTIYYRNLLGCPPDQDIVYCYSVATPGKYQGNLGFELIATFTSEPSIGPFKLNDQFAEEAFTVYDHPKVLIFRKTPAYDSQKVAALLGSVDWSKTIHVFPDKAGSYPADLMLPAGRLEQQQQGGTWSELFNPQALFNRIQVLGVILWYVCIVLLGLLSYPLVRLALRGLPDRGYPLARTAGLLLMSWLVWLAGSMRIPFTRLTITLALLLMAIIGVILGYIQRKELAEEWRTRKKYFLLIEVLALAFFLFDLFIRYGNPDLWHPYKGGEKPMDFSYFNAVLKSTAFPPYDPWFSGGYLNYYYYGFVLVGVLVKWLAIVPSFAYNLILPTLFSMTALGAFSVAWNIYVRWMDAKSASQGKNRTTKDAKEREMARMEDAGATGGGGLEASGGTGESPGEGGPVGTGGPGTRPGEGQSDDADGVRTRPRVRISMPVMVGLAAAVMMVVLGNLGTVGMIVDGLQRLGGGPSSVTTVSPITKRIGWIANGIVKAVKSAQLPYAPGDWYWIPSRIIPAQGDVEPITEFPYFTFLYADPHAHMMALPVALLALGWAVSLVLGWGKGQSRGGLALTWLGIGLSFFLGSLASGALYPINLSDRYTYLAIGTVAVAYSFWRLADMDALHWLPQMPNFSRRLLLIAAGVIVFVALNMVLWRPYNEWYGPAYGLVDWWRGPRTPITSYLAHWGLFLFIIISWMFWETRDWMAHTPLSAARKLEPYMGWFFAVFCALVLVMSLQQAFVMGLLKGKLSVYNHWNHLSIVWLVVPLATWAGLLILRPGLPEAKRVVLFLIGTGLFITLMVDTIVVRGDIGRMNTVFKFYLQVWAMYAVCAAAALGWLWGTIAEWLPSWRIPWKVFLVVLVVSAGLYTLLAGRDKITDRIARNAPHTLDGMTYMRYSTYYQPLGDIPAALLDLDRDYRAIRWVQENIKGSPVIVEAETGNNYTWYSRFTIYTGLPEVLGWEWHQMQQRALLPSGWVHQRLLDIMNFYMTADLTQAEEFLKQYNVSYIIFGQLEQVSFPGPGLDKFATEDGKLWRQIYPPPGVNSQNETIIYEVIKP